MLLVVVSLSWLGGPGRGGISLCVSPSVAVDGVVMSRRERRTVVRREGRWEDG